MTAGGSREFDFTGTTRLVAIGVPVVLAAWLSTAFWTTTAQPRWFILTGAVGIGIGMAYYAWTAWSKLVRLATLDDHRLRVVTASGREHVVERADIVVRGIGQFSGRDAIARLHHPGGVLYVLRPPGAELIALLDASMAED